MCGTWSLIPRILPDNAPLCQEKRCLSGEIWLQNIEKPYLWSVYVCLLSLRRSMWFVCSRIQGESAGILSVDARTLSVDARTLSLDEAQELADWLDHSVCATCWRQGADQSVFNKICPKIRSDYTDCYYLLGPNSKFVAVQICELKAFTTGEIENVLYYSTARIYHFIFARFNIFWIEND